MWSAIRSGSMHARSDQALPIWIERRRGASVLYGRVEGDRPRLGDLRHVGQDRLERAVILEELVELALDIRLDLVRSAIAHPGVLVGGLHDGNAGFLADRFVGHDA